MATLTIRMPDEKHNRLKALTKHRHVSINRLIDELSTQALAEFDSEVRFVHLLQMAILDVAWNYLTNLMLTFSKANYVIRHLPLAVEQPLLEVHLQSTPDVCRLASKASRWI